METLGRYAARYGLVLTLFWIGGMKFTAYEAEGISGFVANSPLMSWAYSVWHSKFLGCWGYGDRHRLMMPSAVSRAAFVGSGWPSACS
jgi:uncharacterized membrane protein YkgB